MLFLTMGVSARFLPVFQTNMSFEMSLALGASAFFILNGNKPVVCKDKWTPLKGPTERLSAE